jgi:hypothetical protein
LVAEMLRQLDGSDPGGPWRQISEAIKDGKDYSARLLLKAYLDARDTTTDPFVRPSDPTLARGEDQPDCSTSSGASP